MRLAITRIARGTFSAKIDAARVVCTTREAWQALWEEHTSDEDPAPPLPEVDFDESAVLAVFAGQRPSSGWTVEITGVVVPDAPKGTARRTMTVRYVLTGPVGPAQDVLTYPFDIVKVPKGSWDADAVTFERVP